MGLMQRVLDGNKKVRSVAFKRTNKQLHDYAFSWLYLPSNCLQWLGCGCWLCFVHGFILYTQFALFSPGPFLDVVCLSLFWLIVRQLFPKYFPNGVVRQSPTFTPLWQAVSQESKNWRHHGERVKMIFGYFLEFEVNDVWWWAVCSFQSLYSRPARGDSRRCPHPFFIT